MRLLKGQALYDPTSAANIPVPTAPLTPIANTSFLLGFSEYQFIDRSPNNFTITRNGDTTQSTFGPYGGNWSNYFDGTGDYLSIPDNAAFDFGTGDFTIECWAYISGNSSLDNGGNRVAGIFSGYSPTGTSTSSYTFEILGSPTTTGTGLGFYNNVSNVQTSVVATTTIAQNTWHHIAVARSGTTTRLFLNGAVVGSGTLGNQNVNTDYTINIGRLGLAGYLQAFNGYISNLRVLKGTAQYTSNFTPPTAPLPVIPNTSLLTCQSNRFLDASPNNFAITRNGDVSVQPYVPFPANWSNYFDGNGDRLKFPDSADWDFGTGDFTIEFWFKLNAVPTTDAATRQSFVSHYAVTTPRTGWNCQLAEAPDNKINFGWGDTTLAISAALTWSTSSWYHYAVARSGTSLKLFLNGAQVASVTDSTNMTGSPNTCTIGALNVDASPPNQTFIQHVNGYVSNVRILKGTALYTAAFTPPTAPLTAITNTVLLTCQSSSFTDFSPNNFTATVNGDVSARFYGPFSGPVPEPVVDVYTTTGVANTWIKRPGAKAVQMIAIGAGGGGGGGAASGNNLSRTGGGGGGGGANGQIIYTADQLPSTLYIRVGASGTGGTSTAAGGAGGNSTIAAADPITSSTSVYCMGGGGGGGKGGGDQLVTVGGGGGGTAGAGTTGTGSTAVAGGLPALGAGDYVGGGGGNGAAAETTLAGRAEWGGAGGGSTRQFGNTSLVGGSSLYGGGGGGQGGSMGSYQPTPAVFLGTAGGNSGLYINSTSYAPPAGAAASTPANGSAGANATTLYAAGHGGGGGYPNVSGGAGYAGGAGGFPGGGGGGGGASTLAGNGGVGGAGGAGRVVLVTFF